jgi:hypothetical protein
MQMHPLLNKVKDKYLNSRLDSEMKSDLVSEQNYSSRNTIP